MVCVFGALTKKLHNTVEKNRHKLENQSIIGAPFPYFFFMRSGASVVKVVFEVVVKVFVTVC